MQLRNSDRERHENLLVYAVPLAVIAAVLLIAWLLR
jgi:hypothetical protein